MATGVLSSNSVRQLLQKKVKKTKSVAGGEDTFKAEQDCVSLKFTMIPGQAADVEQARASAVSVLILVVLSTLPLLHNRPSAFLFQAFLEDQLEVKCNGETETCFDATYTPAADYQAAVDLLVNGGLSML